MAKLDVTNPGTLETFDEVELVSWHQINSWLEEMDQLHAKRAALPTYERIAILNKTAGLMRDRADELAMLIAREGGKPLGDSIIEVDRAINGVELAVHELHGLSGSEIPMDLSSSGAGRMAFTYREPIGPVVAVSAFNHPLNLIVHQVAPALATGCPVLVKPADDTPLSAKAFVEMLHEAGLPEKWCRFALCDLADAEKMVTDPRTAFLTFIGSARVGWMLCSKLAPGTRCALEHGGAAPVILDSGIDVSAALPPLLRGGYYHSGQVCVSVQRIFAPSADAERFAEQLAEGASNLVVGDATKMETVCGPLIRPREIDRVEAWVKEDTAGKIITGGKRISQSFYEPTVVLNPDPQSKLSTQEIFGPVICVYSYDKLDEAIAQANSLPFSFQAAVFTERLKFATRCIRQLEAAAVMVNDHSAFRVDWMPFAGRKMSGYGTGGIRYTMLDMTEEKMAVLNMPDDSDV
ncbi:MAG: aldehyde dehydrogenase family protein [Ahrensia sp.]|nr:aldehyde dehydrogenase family protein [Ahrensia sp.]